MNENKEMTKRVKINIADAISEVFPEYLVKDRTEHERICPECHGLGMKIVDNVYGLQGDMSESGKSKMFPYKHQSLSFCQSCYNGVQQLCPFCGQPFKKNSGRFCDCEGFKNNLKGNLLKKFKERDDKAKEVLESKVDTMLFCEENEKYYDSFSDFFDDYARSKSFKSSDRPDRLWVCYAANISIDASDIIESACEELHDDAAENCDEKSLQELLDNWCEQQGGTTTYYPDYTQYVKIDWAKYEKEDSKND